MRAMSICSPKGWGLGILGKDTGVGNCSPEDRE